MMLSFGKRPWRGVSIVAAIALLAACDREQRRFVEASLPNPAGAVAHTELHPGGTVQPARESANPYENNAWALSEGQRLFSWYNCSGCHANGGGGMGPALMDDRWLYGSSPAQIFATIVEGRPNGMPSFRGRITDQEIWQLVTYVRSLSGMVRQDVAFSRNDHMTLRPSALGMDSPDPKQAAGPQP